MVGIDIAQGNPGCLQFIMQAYGKNMGKAEYGFSRMQDNDIKGEKLYMLWNDCCDRDAEKAIDIMCNNDIQDIVKHINYENGRGIPYSTEAVDKNE